MSGKIFDPPGMLTPFTIRLKCLLQTLWEKMAWDEDLPPDIQETWLLHGRKMTSPFQPGNCYCIEYKKGVTPTVKKRNCRPKIRERKKPMVTEDHYEEDV
ncbi:hypothetical protein NPIL_655731 [Nephila pilipes]|uniref:Uncharacterized protein n=1 Tax=Nephila pilipes TaxID=299642 RepID=A0A8X6I3D5_NEPPI|nr:hypothetical protein NPIL_655731 [Nephila pilipes]